MIAPQNALLPVQHFRSSRFRLTHQLPLCQDKDEIGVPTVQKRTAFLVGEAKVVPIMIMSTSTADDVASRADAVLALAHWRKSTALIGNPTAPMAVGFLRTEPQRRIGWARVETGKQTS